MPEANEASAQPAYFVTTQWSVVAAAGAGFTPERAQALESLCRTYWYPLYAYLRRTGHSPEDAQDLTQSFFTRLLEKGAFALADRDRGRFRTFLLTALNHFLINEFHRKTAQKRGAGTEPISLDATEGEARYALEPADIASPDVLYDQRWAATVLENALARLRAEYIEGEKQRLFECLRRYVWGEERSRTCADLATELGMSEEGVKKAVQRLRQRYAQLVRLQIAETVTTPADLEDELRHLSRILQA